MNISSQAMVTMYIQRLYQELSLTLFFDNGVCVYVHTYNVPIL